MKKGKNKTKNIILYMAFIGSVTDVIRANQFSPMLFVEFNKDEKCGL